MPLLLETIAALEVELHHPGVRCSRARLEALLHPEFHEVGRSGRRYDRATVISFLLSQESHPEVTSDAFALVELAPGAVLLTYRSAHADGTAGLGNHTLRASLWQQLGTLWSMRYHQGTPAAQAW